MRPRLAKLLIPTQVAAAAIAMLTLTMWPPKSGEMLLIPLAGGDANSVAGVALAGGATLLGTGPFPGSLVVIGDRARIARDQSWTLLVMAAPPAGCSAGRILKALA